MFIYFFAHFAYNNELPRGVHQWAQADRYAIAALYVKGQAFFKPATYSQISDEGEVGVELPLIQFISALAAKNFGADSLPIFYRGLTFLILFIGFYRLLWAHTRNKSFWIRWLWAVFLFSSPLLLFYSHNFSPDAAALGMVLLGLSFFEPKGVKANYPLLLCFILATFLKTTAGIYPIAYGLYLTWKYRKGFLHTKFIISALILFFAGIIIYLYLQNFVVERNKALWSTLFLASSASIENLSQLTEVLKALWRWKFEYLNPYQWIIIVSALVYAYYKRRKLKEPIFYLFALLGVLAVLYIFGIQFINHDYYALATFMPLVLWLGIKAIGQIPMKAIVLPFALLVLSILSFSYGSNQHFDRMSETCKMHDQFYRFDFEWMKAHDSLIKAHVDRDELVFVVYGMEPNLSLCYIDRKGIVFNHEEMGRDESNFYYWLERRKPKYSLVRRKYVELFKTEHANFYDNCTPIIDHPEFQLLKLNGY